jgi:hypothetical protein
LPLRAPSVVHWGPLSTAAEGTPPVEVEAQEVPGGPIPRSTGGDPRPKLLPVDALRACGFAAIAEISPAESAKSTAVRLCEPVGLGGRGGDSRRGRAPEAEAEAKGGRQVRGALNPAASGGGSQGLAAQRVTVGASSPAPRLGRRRGSEIPYLALVDEVEARLSPPLRTGAIGTGTEAADRVGRALLAPVLISSCPRARLLHRGAVPPIAGSRHGAAVLFPGYAFYGWGAEEPCARPPVHAVDLAAPGA